MHELYELCQKLGYEFADYNLLETALSHRSLSKDNNERLEYLGDATLNLIVADALFHKFPKAKEGGLSRIRASLVKGESLTKLAQELNLSQYLRLGPGELRSGGANRSSIQADAIEAIIGAIFLDSDFTTCQSVVLEWYEPMLENLKTPEELKDPKTQLQEYLQAKRFPLPKYQIVNTEGEAHDQIFHVECSVPGLKYNTMGKGRSRRKAEQDSAEKYLEFLKNE